MINEEVSRSSLNLEVRLAKATSKAILDALKKVHKQIEEQGGLKNVIKNNGEEVKLKDMVDDRKIAEDLAEFSGGKLQMDDEILRLMSERIAQNYRPRTNNNNNQRNNNQRRKF